MAECGRGRGGWDEGELGAGHCGRGAERGGSWRLMEPTRSLDECKKSGRRRKQTSKIRNLLCLQMMATDPRSD